MLIDVVVDANVWGHSQNPQNDNFEAANQLIEDLATSDCILCVDEGFSLNEADNRSIIGREYLDQLRFSSPGFQLIAALGSRGRIRFVSSSVKRESRDAIKRIVGHNTRDQLYVRVTFNTEDRHLVSHDFDDLAVDDRRELRKGIGVVVVNAAACCEALRAA